MTMGENTAHKAHAEDRVETSANRGRQANPSPGNSTRAAEARMSNAPVTIGYTWLVRFVLSWLFALTFSKDQRTTNTATKLGHVSTVMDPEKKSEPSSLFYKLLFASPLRRHRVPGRFGWLNYRPDLKEAGDGLRKQERESAFFVAHHITGTDPRDQAEARLHLDVLGHSGTVEAVMCVLREEGEAAQDRVVQAKRTNSDVDAVTPLLAEENPLHPAFRSHSSAGCIVDDGEGGLVHVSGWAVVGMWISLLPGFWRYLSSPQGSPVPQGPANAKLLRKFFATSLKLGFPLELWHRVATKVKGKVQAAQAWIGMPNLTSVIREGRFRQADRFDERGIEYMVLRACEALKMSAHKEKAFTGLLGSSSLPQDLFVEAYCRVLNGMTYARDIVVLTAATDSKGYGSDILFRGEGQSNKPSRLNLMPIVSGDLVSAIKSATGRIPKGLRLFGRRLVAVCGSPASWKCSVGVRVESRWGPVGTKILHYPADSEFVIGYGGKILLSDEHILASANQAFCTRLVVALNRVLSGHWLALTKFSVKDYAPESWFGLRHVGYRADPWVSRSEQERISRARGHLVVLLGRVMSLDRSSREFADYVAVALGFSYDGEKAKFLRGGLSWFEYRRVQAEFWDNVLHSATYCVELEPVSRTPNPKLWPIGAPVVIVYSRAEYLVRKIEAKTVEEYEPMDVFIGNHTLGDAGAYVFAQAPPTEDKVRGGMRFKAVRGDPQGTSVRQARKRELEYILKEEL